jgi:hypothetical protein
MESQEIISPEKCSARRKARADFPDAVGPVTKAAFVYVIKRDNYPYIFLVNYIVTQKAQKSNSQQGYHLMFFTFFHVAIFSVFDLLNY